MFISSSADLPTTLTARDSSSWRKQYSGYYFSKAYRQQLWQRYGFERVIRDDAELAFMIGYVIGNPVRAGLVRQPSEYPHSGSERYTMQEMLEISEYRCRR
jgi:REP element-mobilizing transposase RayT